MPYKSIAQDIHHVFWWGGTAPCAKKKKKKCDSLFGVTIIDRMYMRMIYSGSKLWLISFLSFLGQTINNQYLIYPEGLRDLEQELEIKGHPSHDVEENNTGYKCF